MRQRLSLRSQHRPGKTVNVSSSYGLLGVRSQKAARLTGGLSCFWLARNRFDSSASSGKLPEYEGWPGGNTASASLSEASAGRRGSASVPAARSVGLVTELQPAKKPLTEATQLGLLTDFPFNHTSVHVCSNVHRN